MEVVDEMTKNIEKYKRSGFSLIEVVVVIAMMAVLAGVIVPNFTNYRRTADDTKIKTEIMNVYLGAETIANSVDSKVDAIKELKIEAGGKNKRLTKYTRIEDFTGYSFDVDNDGDLNYVRYQKPSRTGSGMDIYTFKGNAEKFMEKGLKSD